MAMLNNQMVVCTGLKEARWICLTMEKAFTLGQTLHLSDAPGCASPHHSTSWLDNLNVNISKHT